MNDPKGDPLKPMAQATLTILPETLGTISPLLHGHFAEHLGRCCYDGLWVGTDSPIPNRGGFRTDLLTALREVGIPILRWPGGCFADTYHWRDGIGPRASRPRSLAESCGLRVVEDNQLGTHEFIHLCREIGAEPYLAGNVGSGSPQEMMDWIHYCNGSLDTTLARERAANGHPEPMNVRYWGVGNENWGCGGNYEATDYAKEFRRYATFLKMADPSVELIACGHSDRTWNLRVVETLRNHSGYLDHLSVHRYYSAGRATVFTDEEYYQLMRAGELVEEDIRYTDEILRFFMAGRRQVGIAFDEWGVWHPEARGEVNYEEPSTQRDAVSAAGVLDTFQRWCARVSMANMAQIVNVLQCLAQTDGEKMWVTPTYHVFRLYRAHRGAQALRVEVETPTVDAQPLSGYRAGLLPLITASASRREGSVAVTLTNRHRTEAMEVKIVLRDGRFGAGALETVAAPAEAVNSAEQPDNVTLRSQPLAAAGDSLTLALPPCSVQTLVVEA